MQTLSSRYQNNLSQQSRKIAVIAILLFALAGLLSGFAVGAFVHPKLQTGTGTGNETTGSGRKPTTEATHTTDSNMNPLRMGDPEITQMSTYEKANATTSYIITAHAVDTSIDKHHGKQIYASGITCKLWIQNIPAGNNVDLPFERLRKMDIQGPLTSDEISGALNFVPGVTQIQTTNSNGQVSWKYSVATSVQPGSYYLVVLMDWRGQYSNWSWRYVQITN